MFLFFRVEGFDKKVELWLGALNLELYYLLLLQVAFACGGCFGVAKGSGEWMGFGA